MTCFLCKVKFRSIARQDSFFLSALGHQAQSQRLSAAHHSISCVSRDARQNVFITERHIRPNRLGRESPKVADGEVWISESK